MRLTRDFSGRAPLSERRRRAPAYAKEVLARRELGERIGLLVVALNWRDGEWFAQRPNAARVVCSHDFDITVGDFSVAAGLDAVVVGEDEDRFSLALLALLKAGAASVWGEFADGLHRVEFWRHRSPWWVAVDGPVDSRAFGVALRSHREASILLARGFYGTVPFQPVRAAMMESLGVGM